MDLTQQQTDAVYDAIARKVTDFRNGFNTSGLLSSTALCVPNYTIPYSTSTPLFYMADDSGTGTASLDGFTYIATPTYLPLQTLPIEVTDVSNATPVYSGFSASQLILTNPVVSPYIYDVTASDALSPLISPLPMSDMTTALSSESESISNTNHHQEVDIPETTDTPNALSEEPQEQLSAFNYLPDDTFMLATLPVENDTLSAENQQSDTMDEMAETTSLQESLKSAEIQAEQADPNTEIALSEVSELLSVNVPTDIDIRARSQIMPVQAENTVENTVMTKTNTQPTTVLSNESGKLTASAEQQKKITNLSAKNPKTPAMSLQQSASQSGIALQQAQQAQQQAQQQKSNLLVRTGDWIQRNIFDRVGDWMPIGILGKAVKMVGNVFTGLLKTVGHLFDGNWSNAGKTGLSWLKDTAIVGGTTVGVYALGKQFGWWGKSDTTNSATTTSSATTATATNSNTTLNTSSASLAIQSNTSQNATARLGTPVTLNESESTQTLIRNSQHTNG